MALIMGILFYETGFLEYKVLSKANAEGYAMFFCLILVFVSLPRRRPRWSAPSCTPSSWPSVSR